MTKIYDDVLGREETIHETVTPEKGIEIKLNDIEPQIPFEEALKDMGVEE